ncbi:MAG: DNA repair protein RecN [Pseudomonadales bacterium]|jgi:DNA repair protein RecN (Recombination protein N)|nr:DNA repair protein RecN [Pseudomonadales bacterium]
MLARLDIRDFTLVEQLSVEFPGGFSPITGETGAGKSILLGALALVLGDRASADLVRKGAAGADVCAEFDLTTNPDASSWLAERDLLDADDTAHCLLRRTVSAEGRSRAFVNGRPATLQDVRALAEHLVDIHSQHAHTSLLRRHTQLLLLDEFGAHRDLAREVSALHGSWRRLADELRILRDAAREQADRRQLLAYQLEELDVLAPSAEELEALEAEQRRLAGADAAIERLNTARSGLEEDDDAVVDCLARIASLLAAVEDPDPRLAAARDLLASARVHAEEAADEIRRYTDGLEPDPRRLAQVEQRLGALHDAARKHRVRAEELATHHEALRSEYAALDATDARLEALEAEVSTAREALHAKARRLSTARRKAATALAKAVTAQLTELGMKDARFQPSLRPLEDETAGPNGLETVEFCFSANSGTDPAPLGRIASGGELSRISLAIQVVTAATSRTPSLVLDEADVGIGGRTAEVVGQLLRRLGAHTQVLAVTHLPQVAALGHAHFVVSKEAGAARRVATRIERLSEDARVAELARMLGGVEITEQTRAHATEMLERGRSAA